MPDAYAQSYGCIISYSASAQIEGNLCNGFGSAGGGIGLAGGVSTVTLPHSDHVRFLNNTIINTAANSASSGSKGMSYGCHYTGGSANYGEISGNHIYGPFNMAFEIGDSSSGGCPVEFTAHDNQIYSATTGFLVYKATGSISNTLFSGVTTPTSLSTFIAETSTSTTPKVLASGTTGVTQIAADNTNAIATDQFVQTALSTAVGSPTRMVFGSGVMSQNFNLANTAPYQLNVVPAYFDKSITFLRFIIQDSGTLAGCTTWPVVSLYDRTTSTPIYSMTLTNATGWDSGDISATTTAGHVIGVYLTTTPVGCTSGTTTFLGYAATYKMTGAN